MSDFKHKSVIVTGSSSGIGESTAVMFASRGANVALCGRDVARLQQVLDKCRRAAHEAGHDTSKFVCLAGDLTSAAVREETLTKTVGTFGGLDVLVANHGVLPFASGLDGVTEENFDFGMDVNVKSVLLLIQAAVKDLEASKGSVVVTSSISSTLAYPDFLVYYMSKAAIDQMVRCLALGLASKGIRVNAINPTYVSTRVYRDWPGEPESSDVAQFFRSSHPLHGRASEPEEQAEVILFLASPAARFVTGECVKVDGAVSLRGLPSNYFKPSS